MYKITIKTIIITFLFIAVPVSASAWSWQGLFSQESKAKNNNVEKLSDLEKKEVDKKYNAWAKACDSSDINDLAENKDNLKFSEEEANYIAKKMLDNCSDPMLSSPKIDFKPGFISLEGYLLKPLTGPVALDIIVYPSDDKLEFEILKSRYRGFYFPPFLANRILQKPLNKLLDTLYSHDDYNTIEPVIKEDKMIIRYY